MVSGGEKWWARRWTVVLGQWAAVVAAAAAVGWENAALPRVFVRLVVAARVWRVMCGGPLVWVIVVGVARTGLGWGRRDGVPGVGIIGRLLSCCCCGSRLGFCLGLLFAASGTLEACVVAGLVGLVLTVWRVMGFM